MRILSLNKLVLSLIIVSSTIANAVDFTVELTPAANSVGDTQLSSISISKVTNLQSSLDSKADQSSVTSSLALKANISSLGPFATASSLSSSDIPSLLSSKISDFASSVLSVIQSDTPVAVFGSGTISGTIAAFGTYNKVIYSVTDNPYNAYVNGVFTAPKAGYYNISAAFYMSSSSINLGEFSIIGIRKNGSVIASNFFRVVQPNGNGPISNPISANAIYLNLNDTLEIVSMSGLSGTPFYTNPIDASQSYISIIRSR